MKFAPLEKYPAVERDFSFVFADPISFVEMRKTIVAELDMARCGVSSSGDFPGGSIAAGKYSASLRVRFQSAERTLREDEVVQWSGKIVAALRGAGRGAEGLASPGCTSGAKARIHT